MLPMAIFLCQCKFLHQYILLVINNLIIINYNKLINYIVSYTERMKGYVLFQLESSENTMYCSIVTNLRGKDVG